MITWRARTHKPCEAILLAAYMTDRAKSGTRRSPGGAAGVGERERGRHAFWAAGAQHHGGPSRVLQRQTFPRDPQRIDPKRETRRHPDESAVPVRPRAPIRS